MDLLLQAALATTVSDSEYPECPPVNHTRAGNGNDASSGNVSTQECPDLSEGYDPAVFSLIEQHPRLPVDASQHPIYGESTSVFCRNGSISNTNDPYFDLATSTMAPESQQDDFRSVMLPVSQLDDFQPILMPVDQLDDSQFNVIPTRVPFIVE